MADDIADIAIGQGDSTVTEFATYEEYLDSQITPLDLYYLEVTTTLYKREKISASFPMIRTRNSLGNWWNWVTEARVNHSNEKNLKIVKRRQRISDCQRDWPPMSCRRMARMCLRIRF
jgi:hypothetical protein